MADITPLEQLETALQRVAAKRAVALGLAQLESQVTIKLTVKQQVFTAELTEEDWKRLLDLNLSRWERSVINRLKQNGNVFFDPTRDKGYQNLALDALQNKLQAYAAPMYLSRSGRSFVCIQKRLVVQQPSE